MGGGEWMGDWGDGSGEWRSVSSRQLGLGCSARARARARGNRLLLRLLLPGRSQAWGDKSLPRPAKPSSRPWGGSLLEEKRTKVEELANYGRVRRRSRGGELGKPPRVAN